MLSNGVLSNDCKQSLAGAVCDIIDEYRHGNSDNIDSLHIFIGCLANADKAEASLYHNARETPAYLFLKELHGCVLSTMKSFQERAIE